jgi:carbon monoxide dehydrogenase subunit G
MKLELNGDFDVSASAAETYAFITAPSSFAPVLPYFKELKDVEERSFVVVLEVGVPQIRGVVEVSTELIEEQPTHHVVYKARARHPLGMMDSTATFDIAGTQSGSVVKWQTESVVSGTLASLANGILLPLARRQIKSLVASVQASLNGAAERAPEKTASALRRGAGSLRGLFGSVKGGADQP